VFVRGAAVIPRDKEREVPCAGPDAAMWDWVIDGEGWINQQARWQAAVKICLRSCPVMAACEASRGKRDYGVWGGRIFTPKGVKG
jgi:hypothetical protein